jgi:hypothetical protein
VAALLVYMLTLAPDITWAHDGADGGDLITAVVTGGVPHPPGYPTYLLLATPWARLPLGNPAWRLNLFSALAAAGAAGLTTLAVARMAELARHSPQVAGAAGTGAGLALAFSPLPWSQAVITEVYALGVLFAALLVFLAGMTTSCATTRDCPYREAMFGAATGLALGAQPTLILAGLLAPFALGRQWKGWAWAGLGLAAGLLVFLVLPIRASSGSPVNWGNASTLNGFWWLVSAQLYRGYAFALPVSSLGERLVAWASLAARQFTPVGALLAGWGWWRLFKLQRGLAKATLGMFAGWSIFAIGYNTTDSYVYLVPAFVLVAVWLGVGLAEVLSRTRWPLVLQWGVVLLLPLAELLLGWSAADVHTDRTAVSFGQAILEQAPPHAILMTGQDAHTFTLWYFRYARGQRPDVTVVDRDLLAMPWYRAALVRETGLRDLAAMTDPLAILTASGWPMCQVSSMSLECQ